MQEAQRKPAAEPSHIVVDKDVNVKFGKVSFGGNAYCIGTKKYCQEWQLANGKRATTEVIPF